MTTDLIQRQQARFPLAHAHAQAVTAQIPPPDSRAIFTRLDQAAASNRPGKRIRLILEAADLLVAPALPLAPCRKGCSHCCHQAVTITEAEARKLAEVSGRNIAALPRDIVPSTDAELAGVPCPFLVDGACSVYAVRPLACRLLINLDRDALLCQIVPGQPAQVPYLDTRQFAQLAAVLLQGQNLADVRQFFPAVES